MDTSSQILNRFRAFFSGLSDVTRSHAVEMFSFSEIGLKHC